MPGSRPSTPTSAVLMLTTPSTAFVARAGGAAIRIRQETSRPCPRRMPGCRPRRAPVAPLPRRAEIHDRGGIRRQGHAAARAGQPALVALPAVVDAGTALHAVPKLGRKRRAQPGVQADLVGLAGWGRWGSVGSHGVVRNCAGKYRMHTASSGQERSSQPWIVQYPPGCVASHEREPFGLQSTAVIHSSPISRRQPVAATASSSAT